MTRLWIRLIRDHRISVQATAPCVPGEEKDVLIELCKQEDLPCPLWLSKHEKEYASFRRTFFRPEHFIEEVDFDRLEIEFLDDTDKKHKSEDPRNQF